MSKRRAVSFWGFLVLLIVVAIFYFSINPATNKYMPRCLFLVITGYKCPGCGCQRAVHALLHGNFLDALRFNAFFVVALPVIAIYLFNDYTHLIPNKMSEVITHHYTIAALAIVVMLWWVLRNVLDW